jgi:hypothetical protein
MADREKFLERWSRRKREATPSTEPDEASRPADQQSSAPLNATNTATPSDAANASTKPAAAEPEFDLAKLPSLDSITAATDIKPFLGRGVPADLARAALRRAWAADPAIRDFVGLQENDWDFNNPNAIAGFGELPPGTDLKEMVARLFGETKGALEKLAAVEAPSPADATAAQIPQSPQRSADASPAALEARAQPDPMIEASAAAPDAMEPATERLELVQDSKNIAPQNKLTQRRKHGGALPEL